MLIIGCDYHPGCQQIALVDKDTGEVDEQRLAHAEQAEQFYRELQQRNLAVRVGMESSGHSRWFERLLHELGFELWIGDPAQIRTKRVRKQKTDRQDAQLRFWWHDGVRAEILDHLAIETSPPVSRVVRGNNRIIGSGTPYENSRNY